MKDHSFKKCLLSANQVSHLSGHKYGGTTVNLHEAFILVKFELSEIFTFMALTINIKNNQVLIPTLFHYIHVHVCQ